MGCTASRMRRLVAQSCVRPVPPSSLTASTGWPLSSSFASTQGRDFANDGLVDDARAAGHGCHQAQRSSPGRHGKAHFVDAGDAADLDEGVRHVVPVSRSRTIGTVWTGATPMWQALSTACMATLAEAASAACTRARGCPTTRA